MKLLASSRMKIGIVIVAVVLIFMMSISGIASSTITELETETELLQSELTDINDEIIALSVELEELNSQIELTEAAIEKTQEELEASLIEEEAQYESMKNRIRYMYETGNATFLGMIFGADSMADLINMSDFISTVMEYDREMLEELTIVREEIEFEEATLEDEKAAVELLKQEVEEKEAELLSKAEETQTDLDEALAEIEAIKVQLQEEEEARLEAESNSSSNSSGSSSSGSGTTTEDSYNASSSELDIFAALLDCEAGASYEYRLAVATVIMNRVESSKFPNTITGVIYESGQFSPTWTGKLDRQLASGASSLSYQVAQDAIDGMRLESVSSCYYFLYAASTSRDGVVIGGNVFFSTW